MTPHYLKHITHLMIWSLREHCLHVTNFIVSEVELLVVLSVVVVVAGIVGVKLSVLQADDQQRSLIPHKFA